MCGESGKVVVAVLKEFLEEFAGLLISLAKEFAGLLISLAIVLLWLALLTKLVKFIWTVPF